MDLKVNREVIPTKETIFDGLQEQSVELDYILPDYYPDIFKLVKCQLTPMIVSHTVNGDRTIYELVVDIKIMYCSEDSKILQCIHQKMNYSKTVEFGKSCDNAIVTIKPRVDYVNCRVVNQRRLDLRSAVSVKVKAVCEHRQEVLSDIFGMNVQLRKKPVRYASNKLYAEKQLVVSEDIELNLSKPPILSIIRHDAVIMAGDRKIIANKLVTKGEVSVVVLYSCEKDGVGGLETMQFTLPYSQIVDIDGIDESYECMIDAEIGGCDINTSANSDGENKMIQCEITINLRCTAIKTSIIDLVTDAYSTIYKCDYALSKVRIDQVPTIINEVCQTKATLEYKEGDLECVYDVWCRTSNINSRVDVENSQLIVSGMVQYSVMCRNEKGMPVMIEKDEAFEQCISVAGITPDSIYDANVCVQSCSYTLSSTNTVAVKADLRIGGNLYNSSECEIITELSVDEQTKKARDGDYALKLYYGNENEDIWEIAKRYSTSVNAIMEENDLTQERLIRNGMILIPLVG